MFTAGQPSLPVQIVKPPKVQETSNDELLNLSRFTLLKLVYTQAPDVSKIVLQDTLCKHFTQPEMPKKLIDRFLKDSFKKEQHDDEPAAAYHCVPELFTALLPEE